MLFRSSYTPLAHPNIDTGMGLERLACIMQDVDSIFAVDTIKFILDKVVDICKVSYSNGEKTTDISLRIITDHIRSVTFMIADGTLLSPTCRSARRRPTGSTPSAPSTPAAPSSTACRSSSNSRTVTGHRRFVFQFGFTSE